MTTPTPPSMSQGSNNAPKVAKTDQKSGRKHRITQESTPNSQGQEIVTEMTTPAAPSRAVLGTAFGRATPSTDAEIDYAVGTRVMRWGVSSVHGQPAWDVPVDGNRGYVIYQSNWRPSRNIAQAFQVLEKFRFAAGKGVILCDFAGGWVCDISDGGNFHRAEADTAPRAICLACLAALKAVEVQA